VRRVRAKVDFHRAVRVGFQVGRGRRHAGARHLANQRVRVAIIGGDGPTTAGRNACWDLQTVHGVALHVAAVLVLVCHQIKRRSIDALAGGHAEHRHRAARVHGIFVRACIARRHRANHCGNRRGKPAVLRRDAIESRVIAGSQLCMRLDDSRTEDPVQPCVRTIGLAFFNAEVLEVVDHHAIALDPWFLLHHVIE